MVAWRGENIGSDREFKNKANDFEWFSLDLDESENVINTTQVFMQELMLSLERLRN